MIPAAELSALLFEHDPIGINFGDNTDEYDYEAKLIVLSADETASVDELASVIRRIFVSAFDDEIAGPAGRYLDIARAIWEWPVADGRPRAAPR